MREIERRAAADMGHSNGIIRGHALVFDVRSRDLGGFVEIVRPKAVERALREHADVVALFNHNADAVLGRTPRTLQLTKDTRGLAFELHPPQTQAGHDALELVSRGDIAGASFGFATITDAWHQEAGVMVRELLDIEIREISLTAFPAYVATDVSVAQRSLRAHQVQQFRSISWLQRRLRTSPYFL